jgi:hypothetical protein
MLLSLIEEEQIVATPGGVWGWRRFGDKIEIEWGWDWNRRVCGDDIVKKLSYKNAFQMPIQFYALKGHEVNKYLT